MSGNHILRNLYLATELQKLPVLFSQWGGAGDGLEGDRCSGLVEFA
jgi:hypothetical protein